MTNFVHSNICLMHFLSRRVCNTILLQYHCSSAMFLENVFRQIRQQEATGIHQILTNIDYTIYLK